jgi:cytochrome c oxidase subunit IV
MHIASPRLYLTVFAALMVGTIVTVLAALVDLGRLNLTVALAIAVTKATLVVLFFMHVKYSPKMIKVAAGAGFVWLAIMVVLTLSDYFTRNILALGK